MKLHIASRIAIFALLELAALHFPKAKSLSEKDNWDLSLIEEIHKAAFLERL